MSLSQRSNYYDVLEVSPDATPQEVRDAYLRAKSAYRKDSVAVYTMLTEDETQEILDRIEIAYQTLSNPDKRKLYDQRFEHEGMEMIENDPTKSRRPKNIVSIDRVPPMEPVHEGDDILISPPTEFEGSSHSQSIDRHEYTSEIPRPDKDPFSGNKIIPLEDELKSETEWHGTFLRRVRESKKVTIDDLMNHTKISKRYLNAIEDENYAQLPAPVYVRGFVAQVARYLKLPSEKVVIAYMARLSQKQVTK